MTASLIERLPPELVAHIAVLSVWGPNDSSSLKDFSALARTCSHFYSILNPLLYKHNFKHDEPYKSCVLWAADHGNLDTLKRARSYGADLNIDGSRDDSDFTLPRKSLPGGYIATALYLSIHHENMDIFNYLLDENVDIEAPSLGLCSCEPGGDRKTYPLHAALHPDIDPRFAQELIAKGAYLVAKHVPAIAYMERMEEVSSKAIEHLLRRSEPLAMGASLQYAVGKKRADLVRELLENEADITYRNPISGETVLHVALAFEVQDPDLDVLKMLLAHPEAPVSVRSDYGEPPILLCAYRSTFVEAMKLLLAHPNTDPLASNRNGFTALDIAAKSGSAPMFSLLLRHPRVNLYDEERRPGDKLLNLALRYIVDNLDIVKFLLAQPGARVSSPGLNMKTPLHICAEKPALFEVAKLLLAHPSLEPPQADSFGVTPLLYAAYSKFIPMIELLLSQPSTLARAAGSGSIALFDLIANRPEVDIHSLCANGRNMLHIVCSSPETEESICLAERLLDRGLPVNGGLEASGSPLYCALKNQNVKIALMLLSRGADTNLDIDANHQWGLLHHLLAEPLPYQTELLRELLAKGARVDRPTTEFRGQYGATLIFETGGTPLVFALAGAGNAECMKLLLDAGANPRAMALSRVGRGGVEEGGKHSMLSALFLERFRSFPDNRITEWSVESITEEVVLLLERGTGIGPVGEGPSAFEFASDIAYYSQNWELLDLLVDYATSQNIHPDEVQRLIDDYEKDASG
ncbi:unnamed protein product, partial [Clonostachys solani]